ncbi:MAG: hypothetical protein AAF810_01365 [Cyanobacteria bacterium P01_D01_bin.36]
MASLGIPLDKVTRPRLVAWVNQRRIDFGIEGEEASLRTFQERTGLARSTVDAWLNGSRGEYISWANVRKCAKVDGVEWQVIASYINGKISLEDIRATRSKPDRVDFLAERVTKLEAALLRMQLQFLPSAQDKVNSEELKTMAGLSMDQLRSLTKKALEQVGKELNDEGIEYFLQQCPLPLEEEAASIKNLLTGSNAPLSQATRLNISIALKNLTGVNTFTPERLEELVKSCNCD